MKTFFIKTSEKIGLEWTFLFILVFLWAQILFTSFLFL